MLFSFSSCCFEVGSSDLTSISSVVETSRKTYWRSRKRCKQGSDECGTTRASGLTQGKYGAYFVGAKDWNITLSFLSYATASQDPGRSWESGPGGEGGGGEWGRGEGEGGEGVLIKFLDGGVLPGTENPYPISDQNILFSIPYFRPDSKCIPYFRPCDVWQCRQLSIDLRRTGLRDAPNDVRVFFFHDTMSTATHVTLKMVSQTKQTEYTPYFRHPISDWKNLYPISDQRCSKMIPFGAAHTYMANVWEYPAPPGVGVGATLTGIWGGWGRCILVNVFVFSSHPAFWSK